MSTTIQIKEEVKAVLERMKLFNRETYNDVIERLIEDARNLDEVTLRSVKAAVTEIDEGKFTTHEKLKDEMGF